MYAEVKSLVDNVLTICYDYKYSYAKEQMETNEYGEEFLNIIREFFKEENLVVKYVLTGKKMNQGQGDSEFHKKVKDFLKEILAEGG